MYETIQIIRFPPQGIVRQHTNGSYASREVPLTDTPHYSKFIMTQDFAIFLTQFTVMEVIRYRYSSESVETSVESSSSNLLNSPRDDQEIILPNDLCDDHSARSCNIPPPPIMDIHPILAHCEIIAQSSNVSIPAINAVIVTQAQYDQSYQNSTRTVAKLQSMSCPSG